jgi:putative transposase
VSRDWPHAPLHRFDNAGVYFVTAGTHLKQHFFSDAAALDALEAALFAHVAKHLCRLQAWALFSNHYHLVIAADEGEAVREMISAFHRSAAIDVNRRDRTTARKVWYQYRDTQLTYERSWLARLKYTHENAVHHGIVDDARKYRWCSASWFVETAKPAFVQTVRRLKIDRLSVYDEYAAALPPQ